MGSLKINDVVKFSLLDSNLIKVKDDYSTAISTDKKDNLFNTNTGIIQQRSNGLLIRIAATHAGIVTRNNGFYLPDKMKRGAVTFTDNYKKPVLLHHQDHEDAIGRIAEATYKDTSGTIIDQYKGYIVRDRKGNVRGTINDTLINDFTSGRMPFGMQVDTVISLLNDSVLQDKSYEGLGYIELVANITDPIAIQKLLDGRYLTGSVGATTDSAVCSVCRQDWTETGPCFPEDTEITMSDGSTKPIIEIQIGDLVLTHTGNVGKVTQLLSRHYNDDLIVLDRIGTNRPLFATKNHPIYHSKIKTVSHRIDKSDLRHRTKVLVESGFIAAEELYENEGYVSTPIFKKDRSDLFSPKEAAFLGLYAAEGSNTNGNCLEFSFHKDEVEKFNHYFTDVNQSYYIYDRPNSLGVSCRFSDQKWKNLFEQHVGHGAKNKHLSNDIVFASDEGIKSFLGAFIDGDGSFEKERNRLIINTASKNLAHQLMIMCNNIGITSNLYKSKNSGGPSNRDKECWLYTLQISGKQVETLVPFSTKLQVWEKKEFESKYQVILDNQIFVKFQTSTAPFHGTVYNLEIEGPNNEHSYIANDIAVHNCEHKPGELYDSVKCFVIAGNLVYDEYSFVNVPADRHTKVLELSYNGIQDSIKIEPQYNGKIYEVKLGFPQYDSKEDSLMTKKNTEETVIVKDSATEVLTTVVSPVIEPAKVETTETSTVLTGAAPTSVDVVGDAQKASAKTEETKPVPTIDDLITKALDGKETLSDDEHEMLYMAMWDDVLGAVKEGALIMDAAQLADAKLSAAQRKKLSKSTFCGPGKSFPVPDCAHVIAARRLIGRYKGGGSKDSILTCVSRKAKAMGCTESKTTDSTVKDTAAQDSRAHVRIMHTLLSALEEHMYTVNSMDMNGEKHEPALSDEELEMLSTMLKRLSAVVTKDSLVKALEHAELVKLDTSMNEDEKALLDQITKYEETIGELRDRIDAIRKEYTSLSQEFEGLTDSLVEEKIKSRKAKESYLSTLKSLRDHKVETCDYSKVSDSDLQIETDQLLKVVDMTKITDKLGDGMSRIPTGEVQNPVAIQDNTVAQTNKTVNVEELTKIYENFVQLRFSRGHLAAEAFLARMKQEGRLPNE